MRNSGLILGLGSANERRRYEVTQSLIGWAQTKSQPWNLKVAASPPISLYCLYSQVTS